MTDENHHFELVADDEDIKLSAQYVPGDINQVKLEEQWPVDVEPRDRFLIASAILRNQGLSLDERRWLRFFGGNHELPPIHRLVRFENVLDVMGFSLDIEPETTANHYTSQTTVRFPSAERLNRFNQAVLGGNGMILATFNGREFSALAGTEAYVNEGEDNARVLVSNYPPLEAHDIGAHGVADIFSPRKLVEFERTSGAYCVSPIQREVQPSRPIRSLPRSADIKLWIATRTDVAVKAASLREEFTGNLIDKLLIRASGLSPLSGVQELVGEFLDNLYQLAETAILRAGMETSAAEPPSDEEIAIEIVRRMETAYEFCAKPGASDSF